MRIPEEYPHCGACDEYGHPIPCEACIWGDSCLDSTCRAEDAGEPDSDGLYILSELSEEGLQPCRHRFEINEPACRVCSGLPRGVCAQYAP